jgi:hypothetical protein
MPIQSIAELLVKKHQQWRGKDDTSEQKGDSYY